MKLNCFVSYGYTLLKIESREIHFSNEQYFLCLIGTQKLKSDSIQQKKTEVLAVYRVLFDPLTILHASYTVYSVPNLITCDDVQSYKLNTLDEPIQCGKRRDEPEN